MLGVNHQMVDYATTRKKDLDLVIARPDSSQTHQDGQTSVVSCSSIESISTSKSVASSLSYPTYPSPRSALFLSLSRPKRP